MHKQNKGIQDVQTIFMTVELLSKFEGRPVHRPVGVFNPAALREELQGPC